MRNNTGRVLSGMMAATMMFTMVGGNIKGVSSVLAKEGGTPVAEAQVKGEKAPETSADRKSVV